jgi:hypothetical protein
MSNKLAPGPSGINYLILKWAFDMRPNEMMHILNTSLQLKHHPWLNSDVVVILKPAKPDYSLAKAYQPISLLETTRKILERIVAARLQEQVDKLNLLTNKQFGS